MKISRHQPNALSLQARMAPNIYDPSPLYSRLRTGPAFLFLGQNYLALESKVDPFLSDVRAKYGPAAGAEDGYFSLFRGEAGDAADSALAWMNERSKRLSAPDWLRPVSQFAWSGLYTSAIDSFIAPTFRTAWRDIQPIFEEKYSPSDPRNRRILHTTHLFGSVNQIDEESRPPLRKFDWSKRRQVAVGLARRLPELVTPLGLLLIEGYAEANDWFTPDDLLPIIDLFSPSQVHIFGASKDFEESRDASDLRMAGKLTFHSESLSALLSGGIDLGMLRLGPPESDGSAAKSIFISRELRTVPHELWTQTSRSAALVDEGVLRQPPPLSDDARYREFRNFLGGMEGRLQWAGVQRGFVFQREFEAKITSELRHRLAKEAFQSEPVILHGQSGTGKSLSFVSAALHVANEKQFPVLYIERRTLRPTYADIDRFCKWAEDNGAQASLVLWDGMLDPDEYLEFLRHMRARGRKIVLAGTSYHLDAERAAGLKATEAPATLSHDEQKRFGEFLLGFHPSLSIALERHAGTLDRTFLVALYRLLPPARPLLRAGLTAEAGFAEEQIAKNAAELAATPDSPTLLESQLRKIGLISTTPFLSSTKKDDYSEPVTEIQEFTGLVMVPGQFGLRIPLELLLRTMSKKTAAQIGRLLKGVDLFRWYEDSVGNIDLGPRNALEAKLICMSRLGGPHTEVEYINRLIFNVQDTGEVGEGRDINFAVEFLYAIGPQGENPAYFAPYLKEIARTLSNLREQRNIHSPRLMLQEANFMREWSVHRARSEQGDPEIDVLLEGAEQVIRQAIDLLPANRSRKLRNSLFNELTATLATRASRQTSNPHIAKRYIEEAQAALRQARLQDPDSYYPVDILAWFAKNAIKSGTLDKISETELLADVLSAFQTAESLELDPSQQIRFHSRRLEIGNLVDWKDMEEDAFSKLEAAGSSAGFYLRALRISGLTEHTKPTDDLQRARLQQAFDYLKTSQERISGDARCMDLMFDLWWQSHAGSKLFSHERTALPFSAADWRQCLELIIAIERTGESQRPLTIAFLRGLSLFHTGAVEQAFQTFAELDRESEQIMGRRRIIRSYLASTPDGSPMLYHGTVSWVDDQANKGKVHVEELRRLVDFRPRDFGKTEIQSRSSLGEFHLAFNFVGPIADPTTMKR